MELPIEREDIVSIMLRLMALDEKVNRVLELLEDDGEEEEDETDS